MQTETVQQADMEHLRMMDVVILYWEFRSQIVRGLPVLIIADYQGSNCIEVHHFQWTYLHLIIFLYVVLSTNIIIKHTINSYRWRIRMDLFFKKKDGTQNLFLDEWEQNTLDCKSLECPSPAS